MELSYDRLRLSVSPEVYPPAEDSFLLAAAAKSLHGSILEMGCGCGIASLACAENGNNEILGVDINPEAVRCANKNKKQNKIENARFTRSDLFSRVPRREFDAIIFNPPYLPTDETERLRGPLNSAFDGGKDGRAVLERFLDCFDPYLRPGGTLLLVQSSLNDMQKTITRLEKMHYAPAVIAKERFFFESLCLIRARKPKP